jgi:hypothetical protein
MINRTISSIIMTTGLLAGTAMAAGVPEPFQGHNEDSAFTINYGDVDAILKTMVVSMGRSSRDVADAGHAQTGTRMKTKVNRSTTTEANRFYFEEFKDNEEYRKALHNVRLALEDIPGRMPLEHFSRTEQLAYWLNLYNITVLDELVAIYPEKNLKKELTGKKSILDKKVMSISGVSLSLNDIQYTILAGNYSNNPIIMYGLFQGNIGSPNIRKRAYTGENVQRYLQDNAEEFVNSNRGTSIYKDSVMKVSSLYERNRQYFPDFDRDLKQHLLAYMENPERRSLLTAETFKPDINDWTIADVYGTAREIGGSFATNKAALHDSVVSLQPDGQGGTTPTNFSVASSSYVAKAPPQMKFSPEVLAHLSSIKAKEEAANLVKEGRVTIEELGVAPPEEQSKPEDDEKEN